MARLLLKQIGDTRLSPKGLCALIVGAEALLCAVIIAKVGYTEVDWKAYMQEVAGFLEGERNYEKIKGDTGPCVYPAGFLYVFSVLYWVTDQGRNILLAQGIFGVLYLVNLAVVVSLYVSSSRPSSVPASQKWSLCAPSNSLRQLVAALPSQLTSTQALGTVPIWAYAVLVMSKRIHSLFVLRLFNDPVAALLGYCSMLLFISQRWRLGCAVYSLAVSVKMNMLLYAPGLLYLLLLQSEFSLKETSLCLGICAGVQLLLGLPFLLSHPLQYLLSAFDLRRQFLYQWTVNLRFLPEALFLSPQLSVGLLLATALVLGLFAAKWTFSVSVQRQRQRQGQGLPASRQPLQPHFILTTLFTSNLIGVTLARTLHYQFYAWYFHQIPFLLYHAAVPGWAALAVLAMVESSFSCRSGDDPDKTCASPLSSIVLLLAHTAVLAAIYVAPVPQAFEGSGNGNGFGNGEGVAGGGGAETDEEQYTDKNATTVPSSSSSPSPFPSPSPSPSSSSSFPQAGTKKVKTSTKTNNGGSALTSKTPPRGPPAKLSSGGSSTSKTPPRGPPAKLSSGGGSGRSSARKQGRSPEFDFSKLSMEQLQAAESALNRLSR